MSFIARLLRRAFSTASATGAQTPTTSDVSSLLTELYREGNLKRLVVKFKKASESDRFRTKTGIYKNTVRRLASAKRFKWIEEILEDQKKYKEISREGFAVRLISLYGKSRMYEHAYKVFDEMPQSNCDRTVLSFNAILSACVNSKKFDKVEELFKELPTKLSVEPDLFSYNTLLKGLCEMGSFDLAISKLDEMEKKGIESDLVTFNTLLCGFYNKGRFSDAESLWNQMAEKNIIPDIRSYNAILNCLVSDKKMNEAVEFLEEMKTKEIKPDVFSFNALIRGSVDQGNIEAARHWYSEIEKSHFDPDKLTFATLVPFFIEKGDLEHAYELCNEIFNSRCLVDTSLLQLMVDELVKTSKMEKAKKLVELGKTNSYRHHQLKLPTDK